MIMSLRTGVFMAPVQPPVKTAAGFTLLELMVAISIFAIISLLTMGGLSNILDTQAHTEKSLQRLTHMQMVFTIMSRELRQISLRPVRDEYGAFNPAISHKTSDDINGIEFTHQGRFTLGDNVSLQRVAYYLEDRQLVKKVWQVLDRVEDTQPVKQTVLDNIDELDFSFYTIDISIKKSSSGVAVALEEIPWQHSIPDSPDIRVAAVKISIRDKDFGEIYRIFELAY